MCQKPAKTAKVLPGVFVRAKRLILGRVGHSAKNDLFCRDSPLLKVSAALAYSKDQQLAADRLAAARGVLFAGNRNG